MELDALQEALPAIRSAGAAFVAISPQQSEFNREFVEQKKFTFDLLSDPGNQTAKAYGLVYTLPEDYAKYICSSASMSLNIMVMIPGHYPCRPDILLTERGSSGMQKSMWTIR